MMNLTKKSLFLQFDIGRIHFRGTLNARLFNESKRMSVRGIHQREIVRWQKMVHSSQYQ